MASARTRESQFEPRGVPNTELPSSNLTISATRDVLFNSVSSVPSKHVGLGSSEMDRWRWLLGWW